MSATVRFNASMNAASSYGLIRFDAKNHTWRVACGTVKA
jgi:hypothetical protein